MTQHAMEQLPKAKTPFLQDKRFLFAGGVILVLVVLEAFGIVMSAGLLGALTTIVVALLTNSAVKEALVARENTRAIAAKGELIE